MNPGFCNGGLKTPVYLFSKESLIGVSVKKKRWTKKYNRTKMQGNVFIKTMHNNK